MNVLSFSPLKGSQLRLSCDTSHWSGMPYTRPLLTGGVPNMLIGGKDNPENCPWELKNGGFIMLMKSLEEAGFSPRTSPSSLTVETEVYFQLVIMPLTQFAAKHFGDYLKIIARFPVATSFVSAYTTCADEAVILSCIASEFGKAVVYVLVPATWSASPQVRFTPQPYCDVKTLDLNLTFLTDRNEFFQEGFSLRNYWDVFDPVASVEASYMFHASIDYAYRIAKVMDDTYRGMFSGRTGARLMPWKDAVNTEMYRHQLGIIFRRWDSDPVFMDRLSDLVGDTVNVTGTAWKAAWLIGNTIQTMMYGVSRDDDSYGMPEGSFDKTGWHSTCGLSDGMGRLVRKYIFNHNIVDRRWVVELLGTKRPYKVLLYDAAYLHTRKVPLWIPEDILLLPFDTQPKPPEHNAMTVKDFREYVVSNKKCFPGTLSSIPCALRWTKWDSFERALAVLAADNSSSPLPVSDWNHTVNVFWSVTTCFKAEKSMQILNQLMEGTADD